MCPAQADLNGASPTVAAAGGGGGSSHIHIDKLAAEMRCALCCELFDNPHSLPCQHSFCHECIKQCLKVTKSTQCPLCKAPMYARQVTPNPVLAGIVAAFREMAGEGLNEP